VNVLGTKRAYCGYILMSPEAKNEKKNLGKWLKSFYSRISWSL